MKILDKQKLTGGERKLKEKHAQNIQWTPVRLLSYAGMPRSWNLHEWNSQQLLLLLHHQLPRECCGHLGDLPLSVLDDHHQEARLKVLIHSVGLSLQVSHQFVFVNPVLGCLPLLPTWSSEWRQKAYCTELQLTSLQAIYYTNCFAFTAH